MASLVMKLTKFWTSASLLDVILSTVGFLIMDLVICLAWAVKQRRWLAQVTDAEKGIRFGMLECFSDLKKSKKG